MTKKIFFCIRQQSACSQVVAPRCSTLDLRGTHRSSGVRQHVFKVQPTWNPLPSQWIKVCWYLLSDLLMQTDCQHIAITMNKCRGFDSAGCQLVVFWLHTSGYKSKVLKHPFDFLVQSSFCRSYTGFGGLTLNVSSSYEFLSMFKKCAIFTDLSPLINS